MTPRWETDPALGLPVELARALRDVPPRVDVTRLVAWLIILGALVAFWTGVGFLLARVA